MEKDQDFVKKVKENLVTWMNEAKQMEATIAPQLEKKSNDAQPTPSKNSNGNYTPTTNTQAKNNGEPSREESPE